MAYGDVTQREQAALIPQIWAIRAQQQAAERERQWALEDQKGQQIEVQQRQQQEFQNRMAIAQYQAKQREKEAEIGLKVTAQEQQARERAAQQKQIEARGKEGRARGERETERRESLVANVAEDVQYLAPSELKNAITLAGGDKTKPWSEQPFKVIAKIAAHAVRVRATGERMGIKAKERREWVRKEKEAKLAREREVKKTTKTRQHKVWQKTLDSVEASMKVIPEKMDAVLKEQLGVGDTPYWDWKLPQLRAYDVYAGRVIAGNKELRRKRAELLGITKEARQRESAVREEARRAHATELSHLYKAVEFERTRAKVDTDKLKAAKKAVVDLEAKMESEIEDRLAESEEDDISGMTDEELQAIINR